ncbi:uncharacterized protein BX663DRAFT_500810 [Cokeromyces recurvatus]|uniref:uncharacterized protein n=1 Tax=Cokeromyces recurvatus TaxID=90255 RepID=UPI00221F4846|nr:uncharacterized protein BX663DRAFT_500810 [Cokeromyces recurvatus]KAI7905759.1 hypothetical protein BX663DRAFT_500810 [Cokeromyces recurvatus]
MESFLSTLPPYVHEYLDKYPPTDVFNLLKELVCFAVLYTENRERLQQSTVEFLKERREQTKQKVNKAPDEMMTIKENNTSTIESNQKVESSNYNNDQQQMDQKKTSTMPYTFPEWWGHHEAELPVKSHKKKEVIKLQNPIWLPYNNDVSKTNQNTYRMERARSQIIPDLRSYLNHPPIEPTPTHKKRHSMLNITTVTRPTLPFDSDTKKHIAAQVNHTIGSKENKTTTHPASGIISIPSFFKEEKQQSIYTMYYKKKEKKK